uniref:hypothetical protein n=2 Tax=Alloprevotella sp. TaxID=1872471 RepID=UPI003FEF4C60
KSQACLRFLLRCSLSYTKIDSKIKANLELHKSLDDFIAIRLFCCENSVRYFLYRLFLLYPIIKDFRVLI